MSALQRRPRLPRVPGPPAVPLLRQHRVAATPLPGLRQPLHQELRRRHRTHRAGGADAVSARVLRLDRDVMKTPDAADLVFDQMRSGEADVLVGTQLVAKGLDLPDVTTVGVVNADTSLHFPDYRSSERTFSLLTQVAGRAGRGSAASQVFIQTYTPDHPAVRHARYHDYRGFFREELEIRRVYRFPPFAELIVATYGHRDEARAEREAKSAAEHLSATIGLLNLGDIEVLGPSPAFVYRLKDEFRFEVTLKGSDLHRVADGLPRGRGWSLDVDPM